MQSRSMFISPVFIAPRAYFERRTSWPLSLNPMLRQQCQMTSSMSAYQALQAPQRAKQAKANRKRHVILTLHVKLCYTHRLSAADTSRRRQPRSKQPSSRTSTPSPPPPPLDTL